MAASIQRSRSVWLFNSLDFSGNPKWLFLYVLAMRPDIEAHWIADTDEKAGIVRKLGYPAVTYADRAVQRRAGVYVVNQVKEKLPAELSGATILNLWHGVGVKQIERQMKESHLLPKIAEKYIRNNVAYRESMMLLVTSPLMEEHFQAQINPLPHQIIRADYPQNSVPRSLSYKASFDHDLRARKGIDADARIVAWAPTYRLHDNDGFVQHALPDMDQLIDVLERTNQLLVLKMHPQLLADSSYQHLLAQYADHPRLMFWDNSEDFYEVFTQVDTAVVDYSSIHYDLIAAGVKKFIRYAFDIDTPGVLEAGLDYESMSVGLLARDFDQLVNALEQDNTVADADLARLEDAFWAYRKDGGPEKIVEAALAYEPREVDLPTLYTFDIFDTVIHRRGVVPRSIFLGIRDRIRREGAKWPAHLAARFDEVRAQAESAVRESKRKDPRRAERKDFEISLDEIYARVADVYGLTDQQTDALKKLEIELELQDVIPDAEMVDRIAELREAGETVLLISDMYLPLAVIERMVSTADARLAGIPIHLSNEYGVQKSTSVLYARVFAEIGYDFGEWVHVGDNAHADVRAARRLGITAQPIDLTDLDKTENFFLKHAQTRDVAIVAGLLRQKRVGDFSPSDRFAYRHLAGLLVPYVMWAVDDAIRRGYQTLYFVARDGHFLKIIADAYVAETGAQLKTRYIYGSRRAWRLASQIHGLNEDTFAPHGIFGGARDIEAVALQAQLTSAELLRIVPALREWSTHRDWQPSDLAEVLALMRESRALHAHMLERAAAENRAAQSYMRQEIDFSESFAFVDYWGRGYTQDCLVDIFRSMGDVDPTTAFYYARSIYMSEGQSIRHNFTSAAYPLTLVELILANQPHGTTQGYEEGEDGRMHGIFHSRDHSDELRESTERMSAEFTRDIVNTEFDDRDAVLREIFRFSFEHFRKFPADPEYGAFLAPLRDSVTMGDSEREFAPRLTLRNYLRYLRTLRSDELTRSMPMSLRRSTLPVRVLATLQREVGFRRWVVRFRQRRR